MKLPLISARRALAAIEAERARCAAAELRAVEAVRDADRYARRLQIAHHANDALRARVTANATTRTPPMTRSSRSRPRSKRTPRRNA